MSRKPAGRSVAKPKLKVKKAAPNLDWDALFEAAEHVRQRAYAPYSDFYVGAAVLTQSGKIIQGANVENATYGLSICAERLALGLCAVEGEIPAAIAIVVDAHKPVPPCGMCRQVMAEFCAPELPVKTRTSRKQLTSGWTVGELLPASFDRSFLLKK